MKWFKQIVLLLVMTVTAWSTVSLEIQNVDTETGTLDIHMSNYPGCSYCPDSTYNNNTMDWMDAKEGCEQFGDTTWVSYDPITETECAAIPSLVGNGGWWFDGSLCPKHMGEICPIKHTIRPVLVEIPL